MSLYAPRPPHQRYRVVRSGPLLGLSSFVMRGRVRDRKIRFHEQQQARWKKLRATPGSPYREPFKSWMVKP